MGESNFDVAESFAKRVKNPDAKHREGKWLNIKTFGERDNIYSYGGHFPMAHVFRNDDGSPRLVLLNGDRYSVSTSRHQSEVRNSLLRHASDVPMLTVPFTALASARIQKHTIELLDVKPERWEWTLQTVDEMPKGAELHKKWLAEWGRNRQPYRYGDETSEELVWTMPGLQEIRETPDGKFQYHTGRHWLGDAVFSAMVESRWDYKTGKVIGSKRRRKFISSFDRQESRPLYFLCELPPTRAKTLEDALEALKPDPVILAEGMGRTVTRQGDMFAVPMPGLSRRDLSKQGAEFSKSAKSVSLIGTAHTATTVATLPDGTQFAQGAMYHVPALIGQSWRGADHRRQKMGDGKTWHLIAKNTVPVSK